MLHDPDKSYHSSHEVPDERLEHLSEEEMWRVKYDNILIHGDNLLALKALEQEFAGQVKCIFIDPPYNTGSAFAHYDDGLEHSLWLSMMRDRLELLHRLLAHDGSLWMTIDDNECHYLKVLADEVFGRNNFVANVVWQKKYAPANDSLWISNDHDHLLVYAQNKSTWRPYKLKRQESTDSAYKNPDNDPRGPWKSGDYTCNKSRHERPNLYYPILNPHTGDEILPKETAVWRYSRERHEQNESANLVYWGKDGRNRVPAFKRLRSEVDDSVVPQTIWSWEDVGHTQDAKKEQQRLVPDNPFATPKPERLISRIIEISTRPGDIVLDSFAGSGTTGAVAHKISRRWIMVELGDHCHTHIIPRMKKVIDGDDPGGITKTVEWKGGGGFRYYRLAPTLIQKDKYGNDVINPDYNAEMLAEAMCKHMGFRYTPSDEVYWMHGQSTERDYIYVTTQPLTTAHLQFLNEDVGLERSLLVCCTAWKGSAQDYPNLTLKKIPKAVLGRCEFGRDDYSLEIRDLPMFEDSEDEPISKGRQRDMETTPDLFSQEVNE